MATVCYNPSWILELSPIGIQSPSKQLVSWSSEMKPLEIYVYNYIYNPQPAENIESFTCGTISSDFLIQVILALILFIVFSSRRKTSLASCLGISNVSGMWKGQLISWWNRSGLGSCFEPGFQPEVESTPLKPGWRIREKEKSFRLHRWD